MAHRRTAPQLSMVYLCQNVLDYKNRSGDLYPPHELWFWTDGSLGVRDGDHHGRYEFFTNDQVGLWYNYRGDPHLVEHWVYYQRIQGSDSFALCGSWQQTKKKLRITILVPKFWEQEDEVMDCDLEDGDREDDDVWVVTGTGD